MSTSVSSLTTNFFPSPQNGFTTTTSGSVASGAATVGLNSVAGYSNGQIAVFVIDPTTASAKQTFTGVIDTAGVQVTSVVWTAGSNQTHALGATVVDYATATHIAMMTKGITTHTDQDGTLKTGAVDVTAVIADGVITKAKLATAEKTALDTGWSPKIGDTTVAAPNTVTALGNRSYSCVFNSVDYTGSLSAGMRIRTTRTVAAPTQCTSLNGTTQYYSRASASVAGMTFTDDFVVSAWVKLSSYNGAIQTIASRYNGTSGWVFQIETTGQITLGGYNAGSANASYTRSYQSIPLNKWVHVSAQLDMSAFTATTLTSYVMIDGVDAPTTVVRAGTNPTALIQAGNLEVGGQNGGTLPFNGKIAQLAIYSAKVTQATVLASFHQGLAGTETSLISAYSFNNSINDLNANANNLTANGSAVATNADSPFGGQADGTISSTLDYAIITKTAFSTNTTLTVQVSEGCTIPTSGGVSAVSYANTKVPYLFPAQRGKWQIEAQTRNSVTQTNAVSGTWYNVASQQISLPIGEWSPDYYAYTQNVSSSVAFLQTTATLSTANNSESDTTSSCVGPESSVAMTQLDVSLQRTVRPLSLAAQTIYYLNLKDSVAGNTSLINNNSLVRAELALL